MSFDQARSCLIQRLFAFIVIGHTCFCLGSWRPSKLDSCELHPDIESRILRDVSYWGSEGITEDVALSVCRYCEQPGEPRRQLLEESAQAPQLTQHQVPLQAEQGQGRRSRRRRGRSALLSSPAQEERAHGGGSEDGASWELGPGHHLGARSSGQEPGAGEGVDDTATGRGEVGSQQRRKLSENCNKPQRVLIQNGTVYLTNLVTSHQLGPFEVIGFLVELYEASQVYRIPDVEFTVWFGDNAPAHTMIDPDGTSRWPFPPPGAKASSAMPPVIAWSKWNENAALVVPYSGAFRCPMDSWDALDAQIESLAAIPWSERKEVAFGRWNGFCTHYIPWMKTADGQVMKCPRTHLNSLTEARPDLLDAYDLGRAKPVPLSHQNRHKYIVSTDGWSISSKFDKYLLLGSTVLKAASTRYGFYYDAIRPYVHYLPFMVNSSDDIIDVVTWAKQHDEEARRVAEEGRRFALRHLSRPARLCYVFRLLQELSKKLRYKPSCSRRGLCVPLVAELRFLSEYKRTAQTCRYNEVLLRYGDDDPAAIQPVATSGAFPAAPSPPFAFEQLRQLHEEGAAWPRDDLVLPAAAQGG